MATVESAKSSLNGEWHEAHRLARTSTLDERVAWHVQHAKVCGCRPIPASVQAEIARRTTAR